MEARKRLLTAPTYNISERLGLGEVVAYWMLVCALRILDMFSHTDEQISIIVTPQEDSSGKTESGSHQPNPKKQMSHLSDHPDILAR
jgi:hypothetical protein